MHFIPCNTNNHLFLLSASLPPLMDTADTASCSCFYSFKPPGLTITDTREKRAELRNVSNSIQIEQRKVLLSHGQLMSDL